MKKLKNKYFYREIVIVTNSLVSSCKYLCEWAYITLEELFDCFLTVIVVDLTFGHLKIFIFDVITFL